MADAPAPVAWDALLGSIADLTRLGPSEALTEALATLERSIQRTGERLGTDPRAALELAGARERITAASAALAQEQARVGRDLVEVQQQWQAHTRYVPAGAGTTLVDRLG